MNDSSARLDHQTLKIKDLIADYRAGKIVVPEFQREYVWKPGRAALLIDSLYRGFPISSLLLWVSSEDIKARRKTPRTLSSGTVAWLIDGQQRVITLSRTQNGEEGIDVVFNPETEEFKRANAATARDSRWYRISEIWEDESYRSIRRNLPEGGKGEKYEKRLERVRNVFNYEVPAVKMIDHSFDNAVNAFTRINTLGVKLKQSDIQSAQIAARHTGFIADELAPFLSKIRQGGFTRINIMHLFRVCAFVARPDGRNRTPLHELDVKEVLKAWAATKKATEEALALIRSELGLINMDILWSGALIVPVIAYCAITKPRDRDAKGIIAWMSIAALFHRYSGTTETKLDEDLKACRSTDPIGNLLKNLRKDSARDSIKARPEDFSGSITDKGALFGVYLACLNRNIKDLFSGAKILLQNNIDRHHLLPRGQFPESLQRTADTVANIAFVTDSVNRSINMSGPEVYLKKISGDVLKTQCIPESRFWKIELADRFWEARRKLLAESFNEFLVKSLRGRKI